MYGVSQFSRSAVPASLQPHEPQHARPPCPSPTPGVGSNPCPLNWWCHPAISSSVLPFSSHLQSFPASGSFQMSQLFASGGQSIGVSASASVLPMNTQDWSPLGCTGWISLQSKGLSRVFSNTIVQKHQFFSAFFIVQLSHPYMTTGKTIALTRRTFVGKVMSLLFNMYGVEGEKVWENIYPPKEGFLNLNHPHPGQQTMTSSFLSLTPSIAPLLGLCSASLPVLGFFSFSPYFNHLLASPVL